MNISADRLELIRPDIFSGEPAIKAWFTLKNAAAVKPDAEIPGLNLGSGTGTGSDAVEENRRLLLEALNIDPAWVAFAEQVHGTRLQYVSDGGTYPETDGLITQIPGLALAIQVADCSAVLLGDPAAGVVAAVHAGWRGAVGGILPKAIERMHSAGSTPGQIKAFVSPCISQQNFEVGEEVAEQFPDEFVDRQRYDKPRVDLKGFLTNQMLEQGMKAEHIEVDGGCTIEDSGQFYSYRREKEQSGRMLGLIMLAQE